MRMIEIKCDKCGAMIQVNAELPKCMCQYCGSEISLVPDSSGVTLSGQDSACFSLSEQNEPAVAQKHEHFLTGNTSSEPAVSVEPAATSQPELALDDANEIAKYKNMLKMNMIAAIVLFLARFIFTQNPLIAFGVVVFLVLIPLREANTLLHKKDLLARNGVQKGNIVGTAVLVIIDIVLWGLLLISLLSTVMR